MASGVYSTLIPVTDNVVKEINPNVEVKCTLGYTVIGEACKTTWDLSDKPLLQCILTHFPAVNMGPMDFPAMPDHLEFGIKFWSLAHDMLANGTIKVHKPSVNKYGRGLSGILEGMAAMREGKVSGEKLVYTL